MRRKKDLEDSVKKSNKLMTFRAFSIGFSAAVLALACGSDSNNSGEDPGDRAVDVDTGEETTPAAPERESCDDNPLLAGCEAPANADPGGPVAQPAPTDDDVDADDPGDDPIRLAKAAAENVLNANCGACHGTQLAPGAESGNMNYINDIDQLVANNKIQPLNSAGSRIIQRMKDGSMPPTASGRPRVTDADISTVAQFIDNPRFWPGLDGGAAGCQDQLFTFDDLYQEIANDLQKLDADDALTTRYISLTNRYTAGVCADTSLDKDRQALFKMVNALSTETTVEVPVPIDADETIYRIDIEDYGWDEPVTVVNADGTTTDFTDKWEAIVANNQYAIPFVGDDADDAVQDSGTTVPVMFADSMLDVATIGNLYYALIDVDVQDTLDNFILNTLEIDVDQNLIDEDQVRAGTTKSRISRQDRMVQRDDIEIRQGVLWQSFDFEANDANQSIFEDPFGFAEGGTEAIFTLPNGFLGFVIADADSNIVEDSDILLDTNQANFRAVTSISCANCHSGGLIPVVDEVREIALQNARVSGLNNDEVEQLENVFPEPQEFARIVEQDTAGFFKRALSEANVPAEGGDPVSTVFFRFDQDVVLADAAGDLGLTADDLDNNLNLLEPEVGVLRNSTIDRDDFTQFYAASLCVLQNVGDNVPDPAVCDQVFADLGIVQ
jgi:mono/diheme cytochrome c family protein